MGRLVGMHPRIKLQSAPKNPINVGRALTIKTRSGDNLMLHKALNMAKPGDVIILSNDGGESYRSLIGEIMFTYLASRGAAGIIIDGPIRDIDAVRKMEMPIYATGTNPAGPYKEGPGEINVPISCGGISINPGDIIVMDEDGVIVIPLPGSGNRAEECPGLPGKRRSQAVGRPGRQSQTGMGGCPDRKERSGDPGQGLERIKNSRTNPLPLMRRTETFSSRPSLFSKDD